MAVQIQGNGGTVAEVDGTTFRAQRVAMRPLDHGTLGHYRWAAITGVLPAALPANSEIFQFRWSDATRFAVIQRIKITAAVSTTAFAAGVPLQIDMIGSTAWTVAGTGGPTVTMGTSGRARSTMGNSLIPAGDIRIAATAALGLGTKTLATNATRAIVAAGPITGSLNGQIIAPNTVLYEADMSSGEHPLVLAQNEGFSIRSVAVPITGTWTVAIEVKWAELTAF